MWKTEAVAESNIQQRLLPSPFSFPKPLTELLRRDYARRIQR